MGNIQNIEQVVKRGTHHSEERLAEERLIMTTGAPSLTLTAWEDFRAFQWNALRWRVLSPWLGVRPPGPVQHLARRRRPELLARARRLQESELQAATSLIPTNLLKTLTRALKTEQNSENRKVLFPARGQHFLSPKLPVLPHFVGPAKLHLLKLEIREATDASYPHFHTWSPRS